MSEAYGQELLQYLLRTGVMVKITDDLYFLRDVLDQAREKVIGLLREKGEITVGEIRDLYKPPASLPCRCWSILTVKKITRRVGDKRLPGRALEQA